MRLKMIVLQKVVENGSSSERFDLSLSVIKCSRTKWKHHRKSRKIILKNNLHFIKFRTKLTEIVPDV